MDAYIPQYKWRSLIETSIGSQLRKYGYIYEKQSDNAYHYSNGKTELKISYFHKEIGLYLKSGERSVYSENVINKCKNTNEANITDNHFDSIEEYFKYILKLEFSNIEKCLPKGFYGDF